MPNEQTMPRNGERDDSDSTDNSFRPSRRSYLKAAGAAAVSVPLLAGEGAAATTRHGISFDNVVDMVDAGCDPSGNEPCDGALQSVAGSNTLLKFPSGTYKFTEKNGLNDYSNFGILGEGDVTFTVPEGFNEKLLTINYGTGVLVENITVDQSNATPNVQVAPDDNLQIHDLQMVGQGISPATGDDAEDALSPMVRSSGGTGVVDGFVAHNEGRMGAYARTGVWIGETNQGTITLRNCDVREFSGNGVYASRTSGVVQVEGGTYKNNDLSQVRIGSSGSYVDGIVAETDVSDSDSPNPEDFLNGSGIRLEKPDGGSGAEIRNCDIRIGPEVNADTGIKVFSNYGAFSIENTRVELNRDQAYSIRAASPEGGDDVAGSFNNVSVTGDASDFVGILIEDRPGTAIENCCIQQTGSNRTGVALDNCDGGRVVDTTINASAQALRIQNGDVTVSNIAESGTCPAPSLDSSSYDSSEGSSGSSSDDSSGSSSSSSSSSSEDSSGNSDGSGSDDELSGNIDESEAPEPSENANFIVTDTSTEGDRIPYEVTTSGDINKTGAGGATQDSNDDISGTTADGGVNEWRDAYAYEGELVSLEAGDSATIKLDKSAQTIKVLGNDEYVEYSLEVSGDLTATDTLTSEDSISDSRAEGAVEPGHDVYEYTGHLIQASLGDGISITTEPETLEE